MLNHKFGPSLLHACTKTSPYHSPPVYTASREWGSITYTMAQMPGVLKYFLNNPNQNIIWCGQVC